MAKETLSIQIKREIRAKVAELRDLIPRGTCRRIAEERDLSPSYVYDVLGGRRWDLEILEELLKIGEKNMKRAKAASEKIDKIIEAKRKATK